MESYRNIVLGLVLLSAPALAGGAFGQYTAEEAEAIKGCRENLAKKIYSPEKASQCLDSLNAGEPKLMDKMRAAPEGEEELLYILKNQNALADLYAFLSGSVHESVTREGLASRLEKSQVLSGLGLGPQPAKISRWTAEYLPERSGHVDAAVLAWNTLGPAARGSLPKEGVTEETWAGTTITKRLSTLERWARKNCDELPALPPAGMDAKVIKPAIDELRRYLQKDYARTMKLDELEEALNLKARGGAAAGTPLSSKGGELEKTGKSFGAAGSTDEKSGLLNKTFDNNGNAGTAADQPAGKPGRPQGGAKPLNPSDYALTPALSGAVAEKMKPALFGPKGEFSDTQVGRSVSEFYGKTGGLTLKIGDAGSDKGTFNSRTGEIVVSEKAAASWMMDNRVTPSELINDPAKMQSFARYFAPLVVHEGGGHERDDSWKKTNNLPDIYQHGNELRAFSVQGLFVLQKDEAEKAKGNPYYLKQVGGDDVKIADILREKGGDGVTQHVMPYYYKTAPPLEARAAKNFERCEQLKKELTLRMLRENKDPAREARADEERSGLSKTAALKKEYEALYDWYKASYRKNADDSREVQEGLSALNSTKAPR